MNKIDSFVINNLEKHPKDIATIVAEKFGISVQAVNKHLKKMIKNNIIEAKGKTRGRVYALVKEFKVFSYDINKHLSESEVWAKDIQPYMPTKPNVLNIWAYGFMEMFNNAIEHSCGTQIKVFIFKDVF